MELKQPVTQAQPLKIDGERLINALFSFAGIVEKAQTLEEVKTAAHQLKKNVKDARIK